MPLIRSGNSRGETSPDCVIFHQLSRSERPGFQGETLHPSVTLEHSGAADSRNAFHRSGILAAALDSGTMLCCARSPSPRPSSLPRRAARSTGHPPSGHPAVLSSRHPVTSSPRHLVTPSLLHPVSVVGVVPHLVTMCPVAPRPVASRPRRVGCWRPVCLSVDVF